jgi:hypothetical protein
MVSDTRDAFPWVTETLLQLHYIHGKVGQWFGSINLQDPLLVCICNMPPTFLFKDAVQSDLRMCTKEPSFYYTNSLFRFLFHFMFLQSLIVVS